MEMKVYYSQYLRNGHRTILARGEGGKQMEASILKTIRSMLDMEPDETAYNLSLIHI